MPQTAEDRDGSIVYEDRISSLPDHVLVTILLGIPTKDAVATMILSKRWRFVWTMLPILKYKESDDESKRSVWWFLDQSLPFHKAPVLDILHMTLGPRCPPDADVGKWVAEAVYRGVRLLRLELLWSADPTNLPETLYYCKSLKILSLSHKILVDVPFTSCLPSLRFLELNCVVYENEDSLIRLLSSCPVLEGLYVKRRDDDNVKKFTVRCPRLLYFIYYAKYSSFDNDVLDSGRCLVIDTPALTELDIFGFWGDSCSIENTPCLENVCIASSFLDISFLRSLSAVLFLHLDLRAAENMIVSCSIIRFSRLTKFKIVPWDSHWMDSLVTFLQNTPKLKFLIVDYKLTDEPQNASITWSESSCDPECLSSSLEKLELIDSGGRKDEQDLVEYILSTSRCLKTATISFRSTVKPDDKDTMMEKLKAIPRVSATSQLLFRT